MEIWLRQREALTLHYETKVEVTSQLEWRNVIEEHRPVSSILWSGASVFRPLPEVTEDIFGRHHPHERRPEISDTVFTSYREAAERAAARLLSYVRSGKVLVYAPLRGAYPIWRAIACHLPECDLEVYYPVTSSFVFYPEHWGIRNHKRQTHSGRFANILELKRLKPLLPQFDVLVYVDEIVSGSMMYAHLKEMKELNIRRWIPIVAVGLADAFGARSKKRRAEIESLRVEGSIVDFIWEGCECLISEDNKFMLGWHYVDYDFGPNVVPLLTETFGYPEERIRFEQEVLANPLM